MAQYKVVTFSETKNTLSKYGTKEAKGTAVITRRDGTKVYINKGKTVATQSKGGKIKSVKTSVITSPSGKSYTVQQKTPEGKYYYATQEDLTTAKEDPYRFETPKEQLEKSLKPLKDQGITVLNKPISKTKELQQVISTTITDPVTQQQIVQQALVSGAVAYPLGQATQFLPAPARVPVLAGAFVGTGIGTIARLSKVPAPFRTQAIGREIAFGVPALITGGLGYKVGAKSIRDATKVKIKEDPLLYRADYDKSLKVGKIKTFDDIQFTTIREEIIPQNIIARARQRTGALPTAREFTTTVQDIPKVSSGDLKLLLEPTQAIKTTTLREEFFTVGKIPGFSKVAKFKVKEKDIGSDIIDLPKPIQKTKEIKPRQYTYEDIFDNKDFLKDVKLPTLVDLPRRRLSTRGGRGLPEFFSKDIGFIKPAQTKIKLTELNKLKINLPGIDIDITKPRTRKRRIGKQDELFKLQKEGKEVFAKITEVEGLKTDVKGFAIDPFLVSPQTLTVRPTTRIKPISQTTVKPITKVKQLPKLSIDDLLGTRLQKIPLQKTIKTPAVASLYKYQYDTDKLLKTDQVFKIDQLFKTPATTVKTTTGTDPSFTRTFVGVPGIPPAVPPGIPPLIDLTKPRKRRTRKRRKAKGSQVRGRYTPSFTAIIKNIKAKKSEKRLRKFTGLELRGL